VLSTSNPPSPTPEDKANNFEAIIAAIKAPLSDLYIRGLAFKLEADFSDEQFQQLEAILEETLTEWRSRINLKDYTQFSLRKLKAELDNDIAKYKSYEELEDDKPESEIEELVPTVTESANEESDLTSSAEKELNVADVQAAFYLRKELEKKHSMNLNNDDDEKEEKVNLAELIEKDFNDLSPKWAVKIQFPYNGDGFIKFITSIISKNRSHYLRTFTPLNEDVVDKMLIACRHLPDESIALSFCEDQDINDYQARKILDALHSFGYHIEFTEKENLISESTAKKLVYSKFKNKLLIMGHGNYHNISHHARVIEGGDISRIFHDGLDCSIEDVEKVLEELKNHSYGYKFEIRRGNYTTPAWQHFFAKVLGDTSYKVYQFELGQLIEDPFQVSDEVLSTIFTTLETNKTVWKFELRGIELTLPLINQLANAILINDHLQEIIFDNMNFTAPMLSALFSALCANPNARVSTLNFNNSYIGDSAAPHFGLLLSLSTQLRTLLLGRTYIDNQTCKAIANSLKTNRTLNKLCVFENNFDDETLMDLVEGLLENNTLAELNIYQDVKFSAEATESFLKFREHQYAAAFDIGLLTKENVSRAGAISARNINIRLNKKLKALTAYTWMAIVLHRASYREKFKGKPLPTDIIDIILSFFFPKDSEPLQRRELIKENVKNTQWRTTVTVPVPTSFYTDAPPTREKPLFVRWAKPGYELWVIAVIRKIKRKVPADIDNISGQYIDLESASRLADALKTNTWVSHLNLAMCHLDDDEFEFIAVALLNREKPLTVLNLDKNNLTERSFARVRQLIANGKVKHLMIFDNKGLSNVSRIVDELKSIADFFNAKIHFEAPIKRAPRNGFFVPNRERLVIEVADEKEERAVNLSHH
jgi:hypothetical protein